MKNNFFKDLLHLHKPKFNTVQLFGTILCMTFIFFIGYFSHNMSIASFGFFGVFILMYYENIPLKNLLHRFVAIILFILISFLAGILTSSTSWFTPIVIGLIAFFGRVFSVFIISKNPEYFFVF